MIESMFADKRKELETQKRKLGDEKVKLDQQIADIDKELAAIDAYEAVRSGRTITATAPRTKTRRGNVRDDVLAEIGKHAGGISRKDLLAALGATGDKARETSVSNALANLKKANAISGESGHYKKVGG